MSEAAAAAAEPGPALAWRKRALLIFFVEGLPLLGGVVAIAWAVVHGVTALDAALFGGMYLFTMAGIELGFHRYFAHRQFETVRPLRALFAIAGSMAGEGSALLWSAVHRVHHAHSDAPGDPHSPVLGRSGLWGRLRGFVWSQFAWYAEVPAITRFDGWLARHHRGPETPDVEAAASQEARLARLVADWTGDPLVMRVNGLYNLWIVLGFVVPAAMGGLLTWSVTGAVSGLLFGGFLRHFVVKQVTFAINSVGHTLGVRSFESRDLSRNNLVMVVLTLGSGWHNNHHAFPGAASLRLRWYQVDPCGATIWLLERLGLAWDVRRVKPAQVQAARLRGG